MKETDTLAPGTGRRKWIRITLAAGGVILFLAILTLIFLDPFDWHLLDRFGGDYNAAAAAVPPDSVAYIGVNLLSTNLVRLDDIEETFKAATAGTDVDVDTVSRQVEELLAQELGISLAEDVVPWLGQYVGLAIIDVEVDAFEQTTEVEWVLSAETRDRQASDQFLEKLASGWTRSSGETAVSEVHDGVTMTRFAHFVFGRSGRLVLLASSPGALGRSIDSLHGDSLPETAGYEAAVTQLPGERPLTMFISGGQLNELLASIPTPLVQFSPQNLPTASIQGIAIAFALTEEGVQIDTATVYDPAEMSALQRRALETSVLEPETAKLFPADTRMFLSGKGVDLLWAGLRRALIAELGRADFEESMRLFVDEFGIDPDEDLFPYLDREAAFGILPGDQSSLAAVTGIDLAMALVASTSEQTTLANSVNAFAERIGRPQGGLGVVTASEHSGLTVYEFETVLVPELLVAFGSGRGYLILGTSDQTLRSLHFDGGPSLADRDDYRRIRRAFPEGTSPGLFVDVQGIYSAIEIGGVLSEAEAEALGAIARSIPYLASASSVDDNVAWNTLVIFVEQEE